MSGKKLPEAGWRIVEIEQHAPGQYIIKISGMRIFYEDYKEELIEIVQQHCKQKRLKDPYWIQCQWLVDNGTPDKPFEKHQLLGKIPN